MLAGRELADLLDDRGGISSVLGVVRLYRDAPEIAAVPSGLPAESMG